MNYMTNLINRACGVSDIWLAHVYKLCKCIPPSCLIVKVMDTRAQVSHKGVHTQICGWHMDFNDPWTPTKAAYTTTSTQHRATTRTRCIDGHQCATYVWTRTARPECAAWGEASGYPGGLSCSPPTPLNLDCFLSPVSLIPRPRVVLLSPFFLLRSRREITHSGERKNSTGSTWMLWLISSFFLKEDNSQGWRSALEKVSVALRSLDIAARPQQTAKRVYRVLFAVYSLLNASCSLIRHKFILFKPLLSHSSHTASQSTPPSFRPFTAPSFFSLALSPCSDG